MQVPGVCVADAGQAHEAIRLERIWKAIDNLFNSAKRRFPSRCIYVRKSRRAHVFPGGTITTKFWDRIVFLLSSLRRALTGFMGFRFFLCAGFCLTQLQGIPIGGPLSPIILHIVLSECEFLADAAWENRHRRVMCKRYVDDLLLLSYTMCHKCLHIHIHGVRG